jgi:hypothetical protein
MQAWLMALARKLIIDLVQWVTLKLSAYLKEVKRLSNRKKIQEEALEKIKESSASNKPHEEKAKDAKDFLNTISKP